MIGDPTANGDEAKKVGVPIIAALATTNNTSYIEDMSLKVNKTAAE